MTPKNWSRVSLGHPKFGTKCPLKIWLGCQICGLVVGRVVAHLCLILIIKELKFSVEHDRVVTILNTIKQCSVVQVCIDHNFIGL